MKGFKSFADTTDARIRARGDRRGRAQRVGQVQRRRRRHLGPGRPEHPGAAQLAHGRRDLHGHRQRAPRWAAPRSRSRSTTPRASCPIDGAEVTISRTLFRNGESEYAINGTTCRLLDVQELLARLGRRAPAAHDHRPGPARLDPQLELGEPTRGHRGGGRCPQAPAPQGARRAAPRGDPGEPRAPRRPGARGATPDAPARAPGGVGASATPTSRPSCAPRATPSSPSASPSFEARRVALEHDLAGGGDARADLRDELITLDAQAADAPRPTWQAGARRSWPRRWGRSRRSPSAPAALRR